ncbi:hypothetical protein XFF6991_4920 [Xanthomonas phaseoli pv. phaseoli]|uniref:Uncharacterized protein n=1 Tax=Xanthomonas campestris pv. phaseoli TaxID=317013 RepID=A0A7Z7IV60_XANCH|nr:hypothetical protein XFF6991_4920 [Xanthomonas phaseoli pv. phaseoli]
MKMHMHLIMVKNLLIEGINLKV